MGWLDAYRSLDKASKKAAIHMVSAWAQQNHLVLGQVKVDDKSNEITAIPKLLERLDITGTVITIDAMGCQAHEQLHNHRQLVLDEQFHQHRNRFVTSSPKVAISPLVVEITPVTDEQRELVTTNEANFATLSRVKS